ncbi:pyridoxamine 5'-phosphate oxidase family protein [Sphaerisporangium sp. TRM90804]|uniref:pyridoxamine 5'-phosphate oxidase family protein n=1 Tax=Sphaerisporangium sp. TRM90804 TaxID=3031113 RepID=UPI0024493438|nr:pyridoxamine 5'-phosphate oxidase family protein [Sphaerisporangium sp. TRM90804]MDH2430856.1 pyridoxamine 5'-phosphate oxidase family protein [Sphaerisporangium sp. TRM90804]
MTGNEPSPAEWCDDGDPSIAAHDQARRHMKDSTTYWLTSCRPDGGRDVVPVPGVWLDGALHVGASRATRNGADLRRDARCVISTDAEGSDLVVEGEAAIVLDEGKLERLAKVYAAKYGCPVTVLGGAFVGERLPGAGSPPYDVFEVTPAVPLDFSGSFSVTPWRF